MNPRKNLSLSHDSVARGRELAGETGNSFSAVIEALVLAAPLITSAPEDYWPKLALKLLPRPRDARRRYVKCKHDA